MGTYTENIVSVCVSLGGSRGWRQGRTPPPVADPGFPRRGGANPRGGAPTYYLTNFSQKLHENEENLTQRGGARPCAPPLDPPMSPSLLPNSSFIFMQFSVKNIAQILVWRPPPSGKSGSAIGLPDIFYSHLPSATQHTSR